MNWCDTKSRHMQGICRLSRRWHQQFCHSPSFGPHQKCLQTFIPVREYRQARRPVPKQRIQSVKPQTIEHQSPTSTIDPRSPSQLLSRSRDDPIVREFEQHGADKSTQREIQPDQELRDEVDEVWEELQDVDRQLAVARQGPFGPQSEFMQQLTPEDREKVLKVLAEESFDLGEEEDLLDLAEIDRLMEEDKTEVDGEDDLAVTLSTPRAHEALADHFNKALREAKENDEDVQKSLNLWKWYLRCQQKIPGFSRLVSENVWRFLWQSQSQLGRQQHLVMLGRDMVGAEEPMDDKQCLEYVLALKACDDTVAALQAWEDMLPQLTPDASSEYLSDYYSAGIQLYAATRRPQKAHSVALAGLRKGAEARILVHAIAGWARSKEPESTIKAWGLYLKMRSLLGEAMTPEMYDAVSDALLDTKRSDMALAVFKDMISRVRGSGNDTLQAYQQALGRVDTSGDGTEIESAINEVSLTLLLKLPKQYHNKYFFASWIKKLLGQQRTEAASMVVDLMYERNIRPDAMHLNGIIGAWLRDSSPQARDKAENMAREMIQARVNQVAELSQNARARGFNMFRKVMPLKESQNPWMEAVKLTRPVAAANIETFSLLFDYYEHRRQWHKFEELSQTMLGPAQLRPNSFVMNKWLSVEVQARSFSRFWTLFNDLRSEVSPNVETWGLVWQVITAQMSGSRGQPTMSHRQLFANMMEWANGLRSRPRRVARADFEAGFYSEVVRSFCYQLDLPGLICAMQGLFQAFKATPDDVSVRLMTGHIARILPRIDPSQRPPGGRRRTNLKVSVDQTTLKTIADTIDDLEAQQKMNLVEKQEASPLELEDVTSDAYKKLRLDVMTEFLATMLHKTKQDASDNPAKTLRDVARTMQVDISHVDMNMDADVELTAQQN